MADLHPALQRRPPDPSTLLRVDVYRRPDGCLLIHACPDDTRALTGGCMRVGCALLDDERWTRRLGCPLAHAKGAIVPREFAADLIAEIQVIG